MNILIAPDSFKGTLDAVEVTTILERVALSIIPTAKIIPIPMSDGGDSALSCFKIYKTGTTVTTKAHDPLMRLINVDYLISDDKTAFIESASIIGLHLVDGTKNPALTTTYGIGEVILDALDQDVTSVVISLGGSSTNDGGAGMAAALDYKFYDDEMFEFLPRGGSLHRVNHILKSTFLKEISKVNFTALCDVDALPYGPQGASEVFSPQKGATPEEVKLLESGMIHFSEILNTTFGKDFSKLKKGGAAGALGMGCRAFLSANLTSGFDYIKDISNLESKIKEADILITGEGRLDNQSFTGKVIGGLANLAKHYEVPIFAICGDVTASEQLLNDYNIKTFKCGTDSNKTIDELRLCAKNELTETARVMFNSICGF
ncbi:MAG: glycerate kinase [Christensenellaceae bacterium]|jgi:glycerate kinase|nr:glycerate kinase [Christensenellaceae bacterium]